MTTVAFLGLGAMGARMARRLLAAGHPLVVYNRSPGRAAPLAADGAAVAATPREAAARADVVFGMVTDDGAAREIWRDPERGAIAGLRPGALAVEASTVTPAWAAEFHAAVGAAGAAALDAPVVGSRPQAEAGQLAFLVGGEAAALERARPLLGAMGAAVHHAGAAGHGALLKLVVNTLFGAQVAALAEMLGVASRGGVDVARAVELLGALPTTSPALKGVGALIAAGEVAPLFPIDLVAKDFGYAVATARGLGAPAPVAEAVGEVFEGARRAGLGDRNIAALATRYLARDAT